MSTETTQGPCTGYITQSYFALEEPGKEVIAIDRKTFQRTQFINDENNKVFHFESVIGLYVSESEKYITFLIKSEPVTTHRSIYAVKQVLILPLTTECDSSFISLLEKGFQDYPTYYSTCSDLTETYQQFTSPQDFEEEIPDNYSEEEDNINNRFEYNTSKLSSLKLRDEFLWNAFPLSQFHNIFTNFSSTCHLIQGSVYDNFPFITISRRSRYNAGFHTWSRGSDEYGHSANFVEIEQLYIHSDTVYSFIQCRGSPPLHLVQVALGKMHVDDSPESLQRARKHIHHLERLYYDSKIVVACLTNWSGKEKPLTDVYKKAVNDLVDFRAMNFSKLMKIQNGIKDFIYEEIKDRISIGKTVNGKNINKQKYIIRTNCASSTDRTNIVQALIAEYAFISIASLSIEEDEKLIDLWNVLGDELALQYAGTKLVKKSILIDGCYSKSQNYKDNAIIGWRGFKSFVDGGEQHDSLVVLTQEKPVLKIGKRNIISKSKDWLIGIIKFLLVVILSFLINTLSKYNIKPKILPTAIQFLSNPPQSFQTQNE